MKQIEFEKTEYNYLLGFYLNLSQFEPMTSTFQFLNNHERGELELIIKALQKSLMKIMPKVQDREASVQNKSLVKDL